ISSFQFYAFCRSPSERCDTPETVSRAIAAYAEFGVGLYDHLLQKLIPAFYREEDGPVENPGVLRGIVKIIAAQAALLRRNTDRLWEDAFIEDCDDWAVPYIGDLAATRMVSALDTRGRRVDVARTI